MDLATQQGVGEVVTGKNGADCPAEFFEALVGGVLGSTACKAAQDRVALRGAQPQRGGVFDHLVVLLSDQLPAVIGRVSTGPSWA